MKCQMTVNSGQFPSTLAIVFLKTKWKCNLIIFFKKRDVFIYLKGRATEKARQKKRGNTLLNV